MNASHQPQLALRNIDLVPVVDPADSGKVWFTKWRLGDLDPAEAAARFQELGRLVAAVATPSLEAGTGWVAEHWDSRWDAVERSTVWSAAIGDTIVAFMLVAEPVIAGSASIYLQAAYVHPALQRRGIAFSLNARMVLRELARRPLGSRWVVSDVMNPVALAGWRARLSSSAATYPDVGDGSPRGELVDVAREAAALLYSDLEFDDATGVLHARTAPRPGPATPSGDRFVDEHFRRHVDHANGDTLLVVFDGRRSEVLRCLGRIPGALVRSSSTGITSLRSGPR